MIRSCLSRLKAGHGFCHRPAAPLGQPETPLGDALWLEPGNGMPESVAIGGDETKHSVHPVFLGQATAKSPEMCNICVKRCTQKWPVDFGRQTRQTWVAAFRRQTRQVYFTMDAAIQGAVTSQGAVTWLLLILEQNASRCRLDVGDACSAVSLFLRRGGDDRQFVLLILILFWLLCVRSRAAVPIFRTLIFSRHCHRLHACLRVLRVLTPGCRLTTLARGSVHEMLLLVDDGSSSSCNEVARVACCSAKVIRCRL